MYCVCLCLSCWAAHAQLTRLYSTKRHLAYIWQIIPIFDSQPVLVHWTAFDTALLDDCQLLLDVLRGSASASGAGRGKHTMPTRMTTSAHALITPPFPFPFLTPHAIMFAPIFCCCRATCGVMCRCSSKMRSPCAYFCSSAGWRRRYSSPCTR